MYQWSWNRFKKLHPDWTDVKLRRTTNRFTAPMNDLVPPPHTTGGAIDLALYRGDEPLDMMSPYGPRDHRGFGTHAKELSEQAQRNRGILAEALVPVGITNYPSEFWHWSYGDQGWAYRGGHPHAIYGPITPPGWEPHESHTSEEPLVFVFDGEE
jgi:D-alanyl-D-alanine dipeptidase